MWNIGNWRETKNQKKKPAKQEAELCQNKHKVIFKSAIGKVFMTF